MTLASYSKTQIGEVPANTLKARKSEYIRYGKTGKFHRKDLKDTKSQLQINHNKML